MPYTSHTSFTVIHVHKDEVLLRPTLVTLHKQNTIQLKPEQPINVSLTRLSVVLTSQLNIKVLPNSQ